MLVSVGDNIHEQTEVSLKRVSIDKGMKDIILWFNSFPQVYTFASCQGEEGEQRTYVSWFSIDPVETIRILELFCSSELTSVRFCSVKGIVFYVTTWPSLEYLEKRMEFYEAYN